MITQHFDLAAVILSQRIVQCSQGGSCKKEVSFLKFGNRSSVELLVKISNSDPLYSFQNIVGLRTFQSSLVIFFCKGFRNYNGRVAVPFNLILLVALILLSSSLVLNICYIFYSFSNLFSSSPNKPSKGKPLPIATVKYNAPTTNVQPVGDPNQVQRGKYNLGDKSKAYDFLQDDL